MLTCFRRIIITISFFQKTGSGQQNGTSGDPPDRRHEERRHQLRRRQVGPKPFPPGPSFYFLKFAHLLHFGSFEMS
jgi:hypothetical protein